VLAISVCLLLGIAFIFVNNMTLMLHPERWLGIYRAHPNGWNLNLGDSLLLPRYLHHVVGAIAIFSAVLAHLGLRKIKVDADYGRWLLRRAALVFTACAGLQLLLGLWLLAALPQQVAIRAVQDPLTVAVFGLSVLLAIASMLLILWGALAQKPGALVHAGFGLALLTLFLMVCLRHLLRLAFLQPYINLETLATRPQTGVIILFLFLFAGGLITVGYMLRLVARSRKARAV
jgi:hypothetical protein